MTGTDLEVRPQTQVVLSNDQLQYIAHTEFVPPGLRGNLPAILACVATGRAIGIPDMTALRSIHVIDGKPTFSAELMVMLARRHGHSITGKVGEGRAVVTGTRKDNGDTMEVEFTMAMAERAGLAGKSNWKKYPESMLWARAVSQLCRELFADCFAGATYTPEELGGEDFTDGPRHSTDVLEGTPMSDGWEDHSADFSPATPVKLATTAQKKKLNVLVGKLRPDKITTEQLWAGVAGMRGAAVDGLYRKLNVDPADLHWSPLREELRKDEAHALIELLTDLEASAPGSDLPESGDTGADPIPSAAGADLNQIADELNRVVFALGAGPSQERVQAQVAAGNAHWLADQLARGKAVLEKQDAA